MQEHRPNDEIIDVPEFAKRLSSDYGHTVHSL